MYIEKSWKYKTNGTIEKVGYIEEKKLETSRADEERQRRVPGGSPLDTD